MGFNYGLAGVLRARRGETGSSRLLLISGVGANLLVLGVFKYADFFLDTVNRILGAELPMLHIVLPLAISFFTFQQIAYLVDAARGGTIERGLLNYCLFVCFFPQLIAGPIVHHNEMMPQFTEPRVIRVNWENVAKGWTLFSIGLFKKVVVADTLSAWVATGFDVLDAPNLGAAWLSALSYTLQIYFDFSGYMDMAMGSALVFNIVLPRNFDSPYKSRNIQEFWRRWHMTLSRFLRDYLYIPLGGNRKGRGRTFVNVGITFLLGGLWHGAGWTFVVWGGLHGLGVVVVQLFRQAGLRLPRTLAWAATFLFVTLAWVFFRATSLERAEMVLRGMVGLNGINMPSFVQDMFGALPGVAFGGTLGGLQVAHPLLLALVPLGLAVSFFGRNSHEIVQNLKPGMRSAVMVAVIFSVAAILLNRPSEFIYFQF